MLYQHLNKNFEGEDRYIVDEENLRECLYDQALDDLEANKFDYFEENGPFDLSKILDVFKVAIYGTVDDVIRTYEQVWGDAIIKIEEEE